MGLFDIKQNISNIPMKEFLSAVPMTDLGFVLSFTGLLFYKGDDGLLHSVHSMSFHVTAVNSSDYKDIVSSIREFTNGFNDMVVDIDKEIPVQLFQEFLKHWDHESDVRVSFDPKFLSYKDTGVRVIDSSYQIHKTRWEVGQLNANNPDNIGLFHITFEMSDDTFEWFFALEPAYK